MSENISTDFSVLLNYNKRRASVVESVLFCMKHGLPDLVLGFEPARVDVPWLEDFSIRLEGMEDMVPVYVHCSHQQTQIQMTLNNADEQAGHPRVWVVTIFPKYKPLQIRTKLTTLAERAWAHHVGSKLTFDFKIAARDQSVA